MARIERILIVGGGIAGLTLATALHWHGLSAELVERSTAWDATGAGILLHANGVRMLRALGLSEAVEQAGTIVRRWRFFDQQGEVLCDIDLEELWRGVGPCIGIELCWLLGIPVPKSGRKESCSTLNDPYLERRLERKTLVEL